MHRNERLIMYHCARNKIIISGEGLFIISVLPKKCDELNEFCLFPCKIFSTLPYFSGRSMHISTEPGLYHFDSTVMEHCICPMELSDLDRKAEAEAVAASTSSERIIVMIFYCEKKTYKKL